MRKVKIVAITLILILFLFCTGTTNLSIPYKESITQEELTEMLTYLSSDEMEGRLSGEIGCELAAEYIVSEFEQYGLIPANNGSYYQSFNFVEAMGEGENAYFNFENQGQTIDLQYNEDYIIVSDSDNVEYEGEIAFVGYSITNDDYNDYENIDVEGKLVVAFRYEPTGPENPQIDAYFATKMTRAIENGAKGIIFVNGPNHISYDQPLQAMGLESLANDKAVLQLKWPGAEKLFGAVGIDIAELQSQIDSTMTPNSFIFEDIEVNLKTELEPIYEQTANLVGYLEGNDPELKDEVIIVGAHYDHVGHGEFGSTTKSYGEIHNGADDNASGTVAVLEIAEALSMIKDDLKRTVLFIAFSAEEYGLLGSIHYINYPLFPLHDTVLMINFDMVGNLIDKNFVVGNSADFTKNILTEIDESETYPFDITLINSSGGSDHTVFVGSGIPIIFPTTGLHVRYHTPDDDAEYINFEGLTQITRLIYELIYRVDLIGNSLIGAN